jgi:hypothetical protein
VPAEHVCRVIDAFVEMLVMSELRFERAQAAETGRPGYDLRDLLKLYLYGYLNQTPEVAQSIGRARNRLLPEGRKCSGHHERSGQQRGHIHMEAPISKTVRDRWRVQVCNCTFVESSGSPFPLATRCSSHRKLVSDGRAHL